MDTMDDPLLRGSQLAFLTGHEGDLQEDFT